MQMLTKKAKPILISLLCLSFFAVFNPVLAETTETKDGGGHDHTQPSSDWPGIYNGFLPCADCAGVKTSLALNKNGSYILMTQFMGKSDREFVEKGKFSWSADNQTIILTPKTGGVSQQYAVAENTLTQLDGNGKRFTGKVADRYILRRTDMMNREPSHAH